MWLHKTISSQTKYFLALENWERWQNIKFLLVVVLIGLGFRKKKKKISNTLYNLWDLLVFGDQLKKAVFFHNKMIRHMLDPKHKGIKAWEYGQFLSNVKFKRGMKVLDVGSGSSAMPFYLASKGMKVTAFDLEMSEEQPNQELLKDFPNVEYKYGSMLKLPFKDKSFDLVTCISAIEHLNNNQPLSNKVVKALTEMIRVLKPKGRIFLTSDIYYHNLQKNDRFSQLHNYKMIKAAFRKDDFQKVFLDTLFKLKCRLIGKENFNFEDILDKVDRSIYRGRYFTTFVIYAEKL